MSKMADELAMLSDKEMKMLLKQSLDFNSVILALATSYMGNMDTLRVRKQFAKEYRRQVKLYESTVEEILGHDDQN